MSTLSSGSLRCVALASLPARAHVLTCATSQVAAGNPIPLSQDQITCTGHAFECRVYAENPRKCVFSRSSTTYEAHA